MSEYVIIRSCIAAQHNAWFILPMLWAAAKAVMTTMAVNDAIETIKEINDFLNNPNGLTEQQINEKIKEAIVALAVKLGIGRVTKAIPADKLIELEFLLILGIAIVETVLLINFIFGLFLYSLKKFLDRRK